MIDSIQLNHITLSFASWWIAFPCYICEAEITWTSNVLIQLLCYYCHSHITVCFLKLKTLREVKLFLQLSQAEGMRKQFALLSCISLFSCVVCVFDYISGLVEVCILWMYNKAMLKLSNFSGFAILFTSGATAAALQTNLNFLYVQCSKNTKVLLYNIL